jgi:Ca2+-binding RTX toxin-like protein
MTGDAGADTQDGGAGSDIYVITLAADYTGDVFTDSGSGVGEIDELRLALAATGTITRTNNLTGIERVVIGTGTAATAVSTATTAINVDATAVTPGIAIIGNAGANVLTGGVGNDTLTGGTGVDTFVVKSGIDAIVDLGAGGADVLQVSAGATVNATVTTAWTATTATTSNGVANITTNGLAVNLAAVTGGTNGFTVTNTGAATTLTGSGKNDTLIGGTGNDTLNGGLGNDILRGGVGADSLTGGTGYDIFRFAAGDTGQTAATIDTVVDLIKGAVGTGDLIDYASALSIGGVSATATANQASINQTTGIATFAAGSGTTLADALADIAASFTSGGNAAGEFAFFRVNNAGNNYMFISDGVAGLGANDVIAQMTGVTSIASINLTGGDLTITG